MRKRKRRTEATEESRYKNEERKYVQERKSVNLTNRNKWPFLKKKFHSKKNELFVKIKPQLNVRHPATSSLKQYYGTCFLPKLCFPFCKWK